MKKTLLLLILPAAAWTQQTFDFSSLDRLGANASSTTKVTLDGSSLRMAQSFLGKEDGDSGAAITAARNLKAVYVRSFEYEKEGQYNEADLAPVRAYVESLKWEKTVEVKEKRESTEVYLNPLPNDRFGGLAVITAEPKEVTVVFIDGVLNASDLGKLGGNFGVPSVVLNHGGRQEAAKPKPPEAKKAPGQ